MKLEGYTDVNWAGSTIDRKSTYGCSFSLGLRVISWYNRKHMLVIMSFVEVEYIAAASMAACEAIWLQKLLVGIFLSGARSNFHSL